MLRRHVHRPRTDRLQSAWNVKRYLGGGKVRQLTAARSPITGGGNRPRRLWPMRLTASSSPLGDVGARLADICRQSATDPPDARPHDAADTSGPCAELWKLLLYRRLWPAAHPDRQRMPPSATLRDGSLDRQRSTSSRTVCTFAALLLMFDARRGVSSVGAAGRTPRSQHLFGNRCRFPTSA